MTENVSKKESDAMKGLGARTSGLLACLELIQRAKESRHYKKEVLVKAKG